MSRRLIMKALGALAIIGRLPVRYATAQPLEPTPIVAHLEARASTRVPGALEFIVKSDQIPIAVQQLGLLGRHGSWMVVMFETPVQSSEVDDQTLNLQYSVVGEAIGLDWVLLGPRNVADMQKIMCFCRLHGHRVEEREMNSVSFLRVEDGDIARLGQLIVGQLYNVPGNVELGLLSQQSPS